MQARGSVTVAAAGTESIVIIGAGIAAGSLGIGGAVEVGSITTSTTATIGNSAVVSAGGTVAVAASDDTHLFALSGALGIGFDSAGIGASVSVMVLSKSTLATIGDATVDALGNGGSVSGVNLGTLNGNTVQTGSASGVVVQAKSTESVLDIVAAGGVGLFVGLAGAIGVDVIHGETDAVIGSNAQINQTGGNAAASGAQEVALGASDSVSVQAYIVGVAGGFVGIGGAVNVGTIDDNVLAQIQSGAVVSAAGSVLVNAVGTKDLKDYVISGAFGVVGAGGSVDVWAIGTPLTTSYTDKDGNSANSVTLASPSDKSKQSNADEQCRYAIRQRHGRGHVAAGQLQERRAATRTPPRTGWLRRVRPPSPR